jgi:hypothetical protein
MKALKIVAQLREHGESKTLERSACMVLSDRDDPDNFVEMMWGSWYDIISYQFEDIEIHISKNYIKELAIDLLKSNI